MTEHAAVPEGGELRHRPWLAALLSFVIPGMGQAYAGRPMLGLVMALPIVLLAAVVLGVATGQIAGFRNQLFASEFLVGVLVLNALVLLWRGIAIAHAGLTPWGRIQGHDRRVAAMVVSALLVVTVAMHAWLGLVVGQFDTTLTQVFATERPTITGPGGGSGTGENPEEPVNEPTFEWDGTERINILLLGTDAAPGRDTVLTDVMLVISVDPVAETAVMISVPRDTGYVPLPDATIYADGLYPKKVNELATQASLDPATWCPDLADDAEACGLRTIERSIGLNLGIDGSLTNEESNAGLVLEPGCRLYDGITALAYARSRQGFIEMPDGERIGQTDFDRSERQQRVLLAMRRELTEADTFLELPQLLSAIGRTVSTDFPRDQAGDFASLLPLIAGPDIERVVLGYPEFVDLPVEPQVNYLLIPKRDAIREEMARLFGLDSLQGWYLGSTAPGPTGDPAAGTETP
jgi:anionic cell wall polymer biosynthesis LytR-Cps2A-Psr (LCP) family protein